LPKKKKPLEIKWHRDIYTDVAKLYSKSNCKWCHGRGLLHITPPNAPKMTDYCYCVKKEIDKNGR